MRSTSAIAAVLLGLYGCEQTPDFVASSPSLNEAGAGGVSGAGGMSGMGGTSGGAGGALSDFCDANANVTRAVLAFSFDIENCTYDPRDSELRALLDQYIYAQTAPELTLAEAEDEANRDALCEAANAFLPPSLLPLRWRYALLNGDINEPNEAVAVICPRYCLFLRRWQDEHYAQVEPCLP